jgi:hypothetical protein
MIVGFGDGARPFVIEHHAILKFLEPKTGHRSSPLLGSM